MPYPPPGLKTAVTEGRARGGDAGCVGLLIVLCSGHEPLTLSPLSALFSMRACRSSNRGGGSPPRICMSSPAPHGSQNSESQQDTTLRLVSGCCHRMQWPCGIENKRQAVYGCHAGPYPEQAGGELEQRLIPQDGGDGLVDVEGQPHLARTKALRGCRRKHSGAVRTFPDTSPSVGTSLQVGVWGFSVLRVLGVHP